MSSYRLFKNNSRDFFDYTMDRVLKAVDEDERNKVDANFIAKIISGDSLGGDTTTPQQDVKYVNLNGKVAMTFKIRFVEKSSKYNFIEDPFSSDTPISEEERKILISMHDDAYLEAGGVPTIPKFGDIVVCSKLPGRLFVIEKVLTNSPTLLQILSGGDLASLFGAGGLLGDGGAEKLIRVNKGKTRYSSKVSGIDTKTGDTVRPQIRTYIGPRPDWNGKDIENGLFTEGFHDRVPEGYTNGTKRPIFVKDVIPDFINLAKAFEENFGSKIQMNGAFRTWKRQLSIRTEKPNLAARPGGSNHGWGLAFDWQTTWKGVSGFRSETYKWMYVNAPRYNFWSPKWARPNGSLPEAWHFEYLMPGKIYKK